MKQELESQSCSPMDQCESKKQKIDKKRMIRKNKVATLNYEASDLKNIDTSKLTRQQKAKLQKAKNRQAAQKSRDMHKQYVNGLENELKQLKQQRLEYSRKLCFRCLRQLQEINNRQCQYTQHLIEEKSIEAKQLFQFEVEEQYNFNNFESRQRNQQSQQSSYLRVSSTEDDYSYMKMFLLVCMIVMGVMYFTGNQDHPVNRALMEIPVAQIHNDQNNQPSIIPIAPLSNTEISKAEMLMENKQLVALNPGIAGQNCLNSLMQIEKTRQNQRSLRSIHQNKDNSPFVNTHSGILVCSLKMPKVYQPKRSKTRSPLVRLFLLGSQIKQMISNNQLMLPLDSNIQLNGIYKVNAQIKEVNLVTDHHCLL